MSGFHFSFINQAMVSQNPADSINLFWNQQMMKNSADAMMFMTPSFNSSIFEYPDFCTFGNNLLNPMLAIKQCMQNWNNNGGIFGSTNMFGGMNFSPLGFQSPWESSSSTDTTGMSDEEKNKVKKMEREYNNLRKLLETYKQVSGLKDENLLAEIETALNNSGATPANATEAEKKKLPIERKLEALQKVYNKLNKDDLRKAISSIELSDSNIKNELVKAGYRFSDSRYSYKNADDTALNNKLDVIHTEISKVSSSNPNSAQTLKGMVEAMGADGNNDILRVISYWNDKYAKNGDKSERSIIRFMGKQFNSLDENGKKDFGCQIEAVVNALTAKANYVKDNSDGIASATLENLNALITSTSKLKENFAKSKSTTDLNKLCDEFEKLYVSLRKIEAARINKEVQTKFGFLNDISSTDKDIIDKNIIVKDTDEDLKSEGLGDIKIEVKVTKENTQAVVTSEELLANGVKVKVKFATGVKVDAYKYNNEYYRITNTGDVKKLSNVEEIGGQTPVQAQAGTELPTVDTLTEEGEKTTINNKVFYAYGDKFYLVKDGKVIAGEKIVACKNGDEIAGKGQNYYKYDGVIYKIKDGKIEKASAEITEK